MKYAFAGLRFLLFAVLSVVAVLLTWLLSAVLPLVAFAAENQDTKQGDLPRWLSWFQTHDAPLDEVWRPSRTDGTEDWRADGLYMKDFWYLRSKRSAEVKASRWLRYLARGAWLRRNPAYGFRANVLGYRQAGAVAGPVRQWGAAWESGGNSLTLQLADRPGAGVLTRAAFHVRGRLFWGKSARYVRMNVGWKLVMPEIAMIATNVHPLRTWKGDA